MGFIPAGMKNIGNIQNVLKESADKQGEAARILIDQNEAILDSQNDIIKGIISVYDLQVAIAKKLEIKIPKPLTDMDLEGEEK